MTVTLDASPDAGRAVRFSAEALAARVKFPARPAPASWETTRQDRHAVLARLLAPPFPLDTATGQHQRRFGLIRILEWLQAQPGLTWQERWNASGADTGGRADPRWRSAPVAWLKATGRIAPSNTTAHMTLGAGLLQLICGDVIRPSLSWLLTTTSPQNLAAEMARVRDPAGLAALNAASQAAVVGGVTARGALARVAFIMAAKGGSVRDITVGDCLELLEIADALFDQRRSGRGAYFYQLLHAIGAFPAGAPPTVRLFSAIYHGQLTPDQLIDRYDLACRPVRDLLVDYLRERQPGLDYTSLAALATHLGLLFWKDLETHHPGIHSLNLDPDVAAAWKQRIRTRPARTASEASTRLPRADVATCLNTVRAFYLDIAQWAAEEPTRWGRWAARCPIRAGDVQTRKERSHRKSRMDQRTRERLPAIPALATALDRPAPLPAPCWPPRVTPLPASSSPRPGRPCAARS